MRHLKAGRKFGRNSSHRRAMMRNLVTSLFVHERIKTTDAKAKELRSVAERLITKAARVSDLAEERPGNLSQEERARVVHARRTALKHVRAYATDRDQNEVDVLWKLFHVLGPRFVDRPGGYTRIIKLPQARKGDGAPLSLLEFVDYDEMVGTGGEEPRGGEKKGGLLSGLFGGKEKADDEYDEE